MPSEMSVLSDEERYWLHLAAIVRSTDDAIVSKTLDGTVLSWNPAAERIFGWTAEEMVGATIFRLVPPELYDEEREVLARIRAGRHVAHYETERVRKDGGRVIISLTVSPVYDPEGQLIGASSIKRDITRQRALEQQLRQAQKMEALGQLAGGIAHDFNNILTIIDGFAAFLGKEIRSGSRGHADLLGLRQATERAAHLTQQLLAYSRQQIARPERFDLSGLVQETLGMLRRLLGEQVQLRVHLASTPAYIHADRGQLSQVLVNLAVNARDAMPDGGTLAVSTFVDSAAGEVVLTVRDTGHGMDAATRARLFEPFFTTKPRGRGTGLGLATVFGIVERAGGRIEVDSEVGRGAVFRVLLPLAGPASPVLGTSGATSASDEPMGARGTETVLVVDDEPEIVALATRVLESYGYAVVQAGGPGAALVAFSQRTGPIDLLLTDIVMPGMSGHVLVERIHQQEPRLPVLYMSGHTDHLPDPDANGGGAMLLLPKPFTPAQLAAAVRVAIDGVSGTVPVPPGLLRIV